MQMGCSTRRQHRFQFIGIDRCWSNYGSWSLLFLVALSSSLPVALGVESTAAPVCRPAKANLASVPSTSPSLFVGRLRHFTTRLVGRGRQEESISTKRPLMSTKGDDETSGGGKRDKGRRTGLNSFIAGGLAGSISTTITSPIEVVKTQLQASSVERGSNALSVSRLVMKTDGPKGFFRGLAPGLIGIIPARSVYFMAYSKTKEFLRRDGGLGDSHRDLTEILSGFTAGIVQNTITNPIWMVKTRMQLLADAASGQVAYGGYRHAIRAIWRDEGLNGFYKGMSASYWGCSEGCIYFVMYERLKSHLRRRQNEARALEGLPPTDALPASQLFISSAVSKLCATITTYPHEVIRTRLREQARNGVFRYKGMWQSLFLIAREEGRRGLYAGMGTHVARVVPNMAILMLSYEIISDLLNQGEGVASRVSLTKK